MTVVVEYIMYSITHGALPDAAAVETVITAGEKGVVVAPVAEVAK